MINNEIDDRIARLCQNFEVYSKQKLPFGDWAWHAHQVTVEKRRQFESVGEAIESYDFIVENLGYTLVAWGMDGRAAQLVPRTKFFNSINDQKELIVLLERYTVSHLVNEELIDALWKTIHLLSLSKTQAPVVTGAKALHHLLPKLFPPIDGKYTAKFFTPSYLKNPRNPNTHSHFKDIAFGFGMIARCLEDLQGKDYLTSLVGETGRATSETKLIDNAIIGYVKKHKLFPKK